MIGFLVEILFAVLLFRKRKNQFTAVLVISAVVLLVVVMAVIQQADYVR
jgi:hypothetical protein